MNNEKEAAILRVRLNQSTDKVLKKILESKKITVQTLLENLVNEYILNNLDCFLGGK
jgi:hypothetical protein